MNFGDSEQKKRAGLRTFQDDVMTARSKQTKDSVSLPTEQAASEATVILPSTLSAETQNKTTPLQGNAPAATVIQKSVSPYAKPVEQNRPLVPGHSPSTKSEAHYQLSPEELAHVIQNNKASILSDSQDAKDENSLEGGNIVRDTKRKRFRLIPAIINAVRGWFTDTKNAYEEAKLGQIHPIERAQARLNVIQKATENAKQAPRNDFEHVAEHLKTIERKPIHTAITLRDKTEIVPPSWSHVAREDVVEEEMPPQPQRETETPKVEVAALQEPEEVFEVEKPVVPPEITPLLPEEQQPAQREIPVVVEASNQTGVIGSETEKQVSVVQEIPPLQPEKRTQPRPYAYKAPTIATISSAYIFIGVAVGTSILGAGLGYYFFAKSDSSVLVVEESVFAVPQLISAQDTIGVDLSDDRRTLLASIASEIQKYETGLLQVYPAIRGENQNYKPANTSSIVDTLSLQAPGSFTRAIREITFGGISGTSPFIVMRTTNFDNAFAGMLEWENVMSADLSPLFGEVVTESFDPFVRTVTQTRSAFFKDVIASNKNVRLLVDENGDDAIVYTFTNQNTILITTSREALDALLPFVK